MGEGPLPAAQGHPRYHEGGRHSTLGRGLPPTQPAGVSQSITVHPAGEGFQQTISASGEPEILGRDTDPLQPAGPRPSGPPPAARPAISFM